MATISHLQPAINNLFITFVVDSSAPDWEGLYEKYFLKLVQVLGRTTNAKARLSYILYSSASSDVGPIVEDKYFSRSQDFESSTISISGALNGTVARPLPGGGSASLEGLVRAIEHLDLLNELEPSSSSAQKHIFLVTACPPDQSERVLSNKNDKFDHFGWKECEEWLRERAVCLSLVVTRLPGDARYLTLYKGLNPTAADPIPAVGPSRLYLSLRISALMKQPPSGQHASTNAITTTNSPGPMPANVVSPNMPKKRKATEDPHVSPRRAKFAAGALAPPGPASAPPTQQSTTPVVPLLEPSTSTMKTSAVIGVNAGISHAAAGFSTQAGAQLNVSVNSGSMDRSAPPLVVSNPGPPRPLGTEASGSQYGIPIDNIMANGMEAARAAAQKLRNMYEEATKAKRLLFVQGKQAEAREKEAQAEKFKDLFIMLTTRMQQSAAGAVGAAATGAIGLQNPPRNDQIGGLSFNPTAENDTIRAAAAAPTVPPNPMLNNNPISQNAGFLWRGTISITNAEGKPVMPECFCYLAPTKVSQNAASAIASWPQRISIRPIRAQTHPDRLVQWLNENQPEGIFNLRPISIDQWPNHVAGKGNETLMKQLQDRFSIAQKAIVDGKLVLLGSIELSGGGSNTVLLFHMPTQIAPNSALNTQHQLIVARYPLLPNVMSIPGDSWPPQSQAMENTMRANAATNVAVNLRQLQAGTGRPALGNPYENATKPSFIPGISGHSNISGGPGEVSREVLVARTLTNAGAQGLFDSLGNVNQQNLQNYLKNPSTQATLNMMRAQQQQQQLNAAASTGSMISNTSRDPNNMGVSGATLLDRLGSQSLGHNPSYGQNPQVLQHALQQQQQQSQQSILNSQLSGFPGNNSNNLGANPNQLLGQLGGYNQPGASALGVGMAGTSVGGSNFMSNAAGLNLSRNPVANKQPNPAMNNASLMQGQGNSANLGMGNMQTNRAALMAMATEVANRRGMQVGDVLKAMSQRQAGWNLPGGS